MPQRELLNFATILNYKGIETIPGMTFAYMSKEYDCIVKCPVYYNVLIVARDQNRHHLVGFHQLDPDERYVYTDEEPQEFAQPVEGDLIHQLYTWIPSEEDATSRCLPKGVVYQDTRYILQRIGKSDGIKYTYKVDVMYGERRLTRAEYEALLAEIDNSPHGSEARRISVSALSQCRHFGFIDETYSEETNLYLLKNYLN